MYKIYQIGPNENIDMIAKKIGVSIDELRRINGIGENASLISGSYLIIPEINIDKNNMNMDNKNNGNMDDYSNYVVKQGDTMYGIAKNNNTSVPTMKQ